MLITFQHINGAIIEAIAELLQRSKYGKGVVC